MTRTACLKCGNPKVSCIWDETVNHWTGKCMECGSIMYATKKDVIFLLRQNPIKLVPQPKQTAYSRAVTSDAVAWGRIGGANTLMDMGYKKGIYEMVEPLTFKHRGSKS